MEFRSRSLLFVQTHFARALDRCMRMMADAVEIVCPFFGVFLAREPGTVFFHQKLGTWIDRFENYPIHVLSLANWWLLPFSCRIMLLGGYYK